MTLLRAKLLDEATERLRAAGIDSPRLEARLLLAHALGVPKVDVITGTAMPDTAELARFNDGLVRRIAREPMAYILGRREFWSLSFAVGPGVLIPRPESEFLVEEALRRFADPNAPLRVLDLGTGSGCLLLAFLSERPRASGVGVDISAEAIKVARENARALGMADRAKLLHAGWNTLSGCFDVVIANPPYVRSGDIAGLALDVAGYEPKIALDGGLDGLDSYRSIAAVLPRLLSPLGRIFVELGEHQAGLVSEIFTAQGLVVEGIVKDFAYIPRCLVASAGTKEPRVKRKKHVEKETRSG
jgi:release factor glutamine methyltransferase